MAPIPHALIGCELMNKSQSLILSDPARVTDNNNKSQIIISRGIYQISIECNANNLGWIRDILVFRFAAGFSISLIIIKNNNND